MKLVNAANSLHVQRLRTVYSKPSPSALLTLGLSYQQGNTSRPAVSHIRSFHQSGCHTDVLNTSSCRRRIAAIRNSTANIDASASSAADLPATPKPVPTADEDDDEDEEEFADEDEYDGWDEDEENEDEYDNEDEQFDETTDGPSPQAAAAVKEQVRSSPLEPAEPTPFNEDDYVDVGMVTTPHGIKGELKVRPSTDDPRGRFATKGNRLWMMPGGPAFKNGPQQMMMPVTVQWGRMTVSKGTECWVVKLKEVPSRNEAEKYKRWRILTALADRPSLEGTGEYYVTDLLGLAVYHQRDGRKVGTVVDWYESTGSHDSIRIVLEQTAEDVAAARFRTVLMPFLEKMCPVVDIGAKRMVIDPPDGLLELADPPKKESKPSGRRGKQHKGAAPAAAPSPPSPPSNQDMSPTSQLPSTSPPPQQPPPAPATSTSISTASTSAASTSGRPNSTADNNSSDRRPKTSSAPTQGAAPSPPPQPTTATMATPITDPDNSSSGSSSSSGSGVKRRTPVKREDPKPVDDSRSDRGDTSSAADSAAESTAPGSGRRKVMLGRRRR